MTERRTNSKLNPDITPGLSYVNKPNLLKRSLFLSRNAQLDLYFKIILPSVLYRLVVWGGCPNTDLLQCLELLYRRAARILYNLAQDMHTDEVYRHSNWNTLTFYYKLRLIKLFHNVFVGEAPAALSYLTNKPCTAHNFRRSNNIIVLRFNSLLAIEALSSGTLLDLFYGPVF